MEKKFYTIMDGEGNFMNSNFMRDNNKNIVEAVRFGSLEGVKQYFEGLRKDRGFKIVEINYSLKEIIK